MGSTARRIKLSAPNHTKRGLGCFPSEPKWLSEGKDPDYRFSLANERTFLAWIRTALAILVTAYAVTHLLDSSGDATLLYILGISLAATGTMLAGFAYHRWAGNERAMRAEASLPYSRVLLVLAGAMTVSAIVLLVLMVRSA